MILLIIIAIAVIVVAALAVNALAQTSPSHARAVENSEAAQVQTAIDNAYTSAEKLVRWQSRNQNRL